MKTDNKCETCGNKTLKGKCRVSSAYITCIKRGYQFYEQIEEPIEKTVKKIYKIKKQI